MFLPEVDFSVDAFVCIFGKDTAKHGVQGRVLSYLETVSGGLDEGRSGH